MRSGPMRGAGPSPGAPKRGEDASGIGPTIADRSARLVPAAQRDPHLVVVDFPAVVFPRPVFPELGPQPADRRRSASSAWTTSSPWSQDSRFWNTARISLTFVVGAVGLQYCLGLGRGAAAEPGDPLPALLSRRLPAADDADAGRGRLCRAHAVQRAQGPGQRHHQAPGWPAIPWFSNSTLALPSLMLVDAWEWTPFMMIVLLAGLQSLPPEVFEAATRRRRQRLAGFPSRHLPDACARSRSPSS